MATKDAVEERVQARLDRQKGWFDSSTRELWAVIDEAAIRREVGGAAVLAGQLDRLAQLADDDSVTLQVIPFAAGAHAGMIGSFVIMEFPGTADAPLVYLETMAGDLFAETDVDLKRYDILFDNLRAVALGPEPSAELIRKARVALKPG